MAREVNNVREPAIQTSEERTFQAEGVARSKVPRQESAWCALEKTGRLVRLSAVELGGKRETGFLEAAGGTWNCLST